MPGRAHPGSPTQQPMQSCTKQQAGRCARRKKTSGIARQLMVDHTGTAASTHSALIKSLGSLATQKTTTTGLLWNHVLATLGSPSQGRRRKSAAKPATEHGDCGRQQELPRPRLMLTSTDLDRARRSSHDDNRFISTNLVPKTPNRHFAGRRPDFAVGAGQPEAPCADCKMPAACCIR